MQLLDASSVTHTLPYTLATVLPLHSDGQVLIYPTFVPNRLLPDGPLVHHEHPAGSTKINDRTDLVIMPLAIFTRVDREIPSPPSCNSVIPRTH
ncbi:hypothetical protein T07_11372 [Trichinella nelsoni]|uniref:Uncharacterized protein n=1 Tax=Trichinella nelsoni TaxID=6336 RepID=A0A0V0RHK8_9BILA|nr:hypothetical protein T07_11372 [Trichinella nelsoni]